MTECNDHVDRRPDQVCAYMMDVSKAPHWRNLVRQVDVFTPGPLRVGSALKISFDVMGRVKTTVSEVWACEPERRFGQRNTEQNVSGVFEYA